MDNDRKIKNLETLSQLFQAMIGEKYKLPGNLNELREEGKTLINQLQHYNGWFTKAVVKTALKSWIAALETEKIKSWLTPYNINDKSKKVGVIMAGNIPLVGLHDVLTVLCSNHILYAKLSSKDEQLMGFVLKALAAIDEEWAAQIKINERLSDIDYLIATGSDNSARYFDYYFRNKKKIIRKNRTSLAILDGSESKEDLQGLASDIFTYFGLGCRNVTKLFFPKGYDKDLLFNAFYEYRDFINHNKYANNYDYNKAVYLLNQIPLVENGFLILKEDKALHSPVGVLYYEEYEKQEAVENIIKKEADHIQCVVRKDPKKNELNFGATQCPELWNYADGVDTMAFLN